MNIVLIGYRGTGKSSVAKILGTRLKKEVVSTDAWLVKEVGMKIPDIVQLYGWDKFRIYESEVIQAVAAMDGMIMDAGGGVILRDRNIKAFKKNGKVFWLTAKVQSIVERIGSDDQRPSLTGQKSFVDEVEEVLAKRIPLYRAAADFEISTDDKTEDNVAEEIIALLK